MAWNNDRRGLQLARLERSTASGDGLDRLFRPEELRVPPLVWLDDPSEGEPGYVWWAYAEEGASKEEEVAGHIDRATVDDAGILDAYAQLAEGTPENFEGFVRRFGPLELCKHHLPASHPPIPAGDGSGNLGPCPPLWEGGYSVFRYFTPIEIWRLYAQELRAALQVAAAVHRGQPAPPDAWKALLRGPSSHWRMFPRRPPERFEWIGDLRSERFFLGFILDSWLELGSVRPTYRWGDDEDRPEIRLGGGGVYGAVVRQVAFTVAKVDGLAVCGGCGRAFVPSRRPARGRESWCDREECRRAADRARQRKRRARLARNGGNDAEEQR